MKSILIGLLFLSWTALSQPSIPDLSAPTSGHDPKTICIAVEKARLLVADALRLRLADSLNNTLATRVQLLEDSKMAAHSSFTNLLKLSEQKFETQKENTGHMERLALSYKGQMEYYQKREKKQRKKKNILGGALVVVIVLSLIK